MRRHLIHGVFISAAKQKNRSRIFSSIEKDVRTLFSGSHRITEKLRLPNHLTKGNYEVFFSLPDADNRLQTRPEYSIRFANKSLWEAETGYNNLHHTITIE